MKKLTFFILLLYFFNSNSIVSENLNGGAKVTDLWLWNPETKTIHPAFSKLLSLREINQWITTNSSTPVVDHQTFKSIVEKTQTDWLRPAGKERWQTNEVELNENDKKKALDCFSELGCLNEIKPTQESYDVCFVFGATASRMVSRIATAINLNKKGIKYKKLILLTSQRPRDKEIENEEAFILKKNDNRLKVKKNWKYDGIEPKNENELAEIIVNQISFPQNFLKNIKIEFINTPMQKNDDGSMRRPNTGDTIKKYLENSPTAQKCLFISNNPYIGYQHSVAKTYMPSNYTVETVGDAASKNEKISTLFDNLARWAWQENQRLTQKNQH